MRYNSPRTGNHFSFRIIKKGSKRKCFELVICVCACVTRFYNLKGIEIFAIVVGFTRSVQVYVCNINIDSALAKLTNSLKLKLDM